MLILIYSLIIFFALAGQQTGSKLDIAYSFNNTNLGVYVDMYQKLEIKYDQDLSTNLIIYRYIIPKEFDIIKPMFVEDVDSKIESIKTDLSEELCLERLPRGTVPSDFNDLMNKKYSSLNIYDKNISLYWFYIYDTLTYLHPFNQEVKCISFKNPDFSIRPRSFYEYYVIRLEPPTRSININIPLLNYSSAVSGPNQVFVYERSFVPKAQSIDIYIESLITTESIPVIGNLLEEIFKIIKVHYDFLYSFTKRSYLSAGILIAVIYITITFVLNTITYISNVINYYLQKDPSPIRRALGYHNNEIYANLAKGVIVGVIALILDFSSFSQNIYFNRISLSLLVDMLKIDITFYLVVFGIVYMFRNIYEFISDYIRGFIGGKEFYTSYSDLINKTNIRARLDNLRAQIGGFREELGKGILDGVDVSKYLEFVNSIPLESIDREIQGANSLTQLYEVYQKIKNYTSKIDELRTEYRNLYRDAETNYTFWKDHVKREVKMFGAVSLSSLNMIPSAWRSWFAKRFIEENPDYVISEGMIKRLDIPKSEVLKIKLRNIYEDYFGDIVILFSDGEFLYNGNNKTMLKAIMSKIMIEDKDIEVEGEKYKLYSFSKYGIRVVVFGKKDVLKDVFAKYNI
ncbi:MAG: hypothetical protein N3C61_02240 [Candidatus Micrarchaeota archaeon]|nr:hypothetical protein [Candidatus Micrarchaeota archaeon]